MAAPDNPFAGMPQRPGHEFGDYWGRQQDCPNGPHRGPQGPNEDLAQCPRCLGVSHEKRPAGETYGDHADDCSLPIDHGGYCEPGGEGHPESQHVRGFFPEKEG